MNGQHIVLAGGSGFWGHGVDGGPRKTYDVAVFRSESVNRSDVRARLH